MSTAAAPALVERKARIFRFGHYPHKLRGKGWGITAAEFRAANAGKATVPVGIDPIGKGHYLGADSWLDGKTGHAEFAVEGEEVVANFHLPAWIDEAVREHDIRISAVFDPATKELLKVDLVKDPTIADAVFFAADRVVLFADDPDPEDAAAVAFARKGDDDGKGDLAQHMHEIAAAGHPGLCSGKATFANETKHEKHLRLVHDYSVHHGAYCPGMAGHHEGVGMSDEIEVEEEETESEADPVTFADKPPTPREQALLARMERLEAEAIRKDAVAFAESVIRGPECRALPAERDHLIAGYVRAARDDARLPEVVAFAVDGKDAEGSRVDAYRAAILARPRLKLKGEKTASAPVTFALDAEPDGAADQARDREARKKANQDHAAQHQRAR